MTHGIEDEDDPVLPGPCKVCGRPDAEFVCEFCEERICGEHVARVESSENEWLKERYGELQLDAAAFCSECHAQLPMGPEDAGTSVRGRDDPRD